MAKQKPEMKAGDKLTVKEVVPAKHKSKSEKTDAEVMAEAQAQIKRVAEAKRQRCSNEINTLLEKYGCALVPEITLRLVNGVFRASGGVVVVTIK